MLCMELALQFSHAIAWMHHLAWQLALLQAVRNKLECDAMKYEIED